MLTPRCINWIAAKWINAAFLDRYLAAIATCAASTGSHYGSGNMGHSAGWVAINRVARAVATAASGIDRCAGISGSAGAAWLAIASHRSAGCRVATSIARAAGGDAVRIGVTDSGTGGITVLRYRVTVLGRCGRTVSHRLSTAANAIGTGATDSHLCLSDR
ncbi:hypothetical protein FF011L_33620 [Roseimaritima multifibrata]|uniref:Uncharacterized protein n=1 Tax=Roseimaritima multifibrata TaxID=1930274 RepID=A0A517MI78_9BACT|nr:hypothetical protein FF011L_33620 [Roseimaritima multifibrata]